MFDSSNLPFVLLGALFFVGIVAHLTASRRATAAAMKKASAHSVVFRGDARVGLVHCRVSGSDRARLREALDKAPPSFIRTLGSPDVRNVVAACVIDLPAEAREEAVKARLAEQKLKLESFEVLVDIVYDEGCRRLEGWAASPCKYGASNFVISCTALELWLDAHARLSMWVHKPNGEWMFLRPLRFKKENKPLWVYKLGSGSGAKTPKTFEAMRMDS